MFEPEVTPPLIAPLSVTPNQENLRHPNVTFSANAKSSCDKIGTDAHSLPTSDVNAQASGKALKSKPKHPRARDNSGHANRVVTWPRVTWRGVNCQSGQSTNQQATVKYESTWRLKRMEWGEKAEHEFQPISGRISFLCCKQFDQHVLQKIKIWYKKGYITKGYITGTRQRSRPRW